MQRGDKTTEVNEQILSQLDKLNESHAAQNAHLFAKGLPFYTCIDSTNDQWTKEFPDGQILLVKRDFNFEQDSPVDSFIRRIK
jgi:hypothetical protein